MSAGTGIAVAATVLALTLLWVNRDRDGIIRRKRRRRINRARGDLLWWLPW